MAIERDHDDEITWAPKEAQVSDSEPIAFRRRQSQPSGNPGQPLDFTVPQNARPAAVVAFNRIELNDILNVYGRRVGSGDWRDYAIDMGRESAVFSIFRRASEVPIYRIEKTPKFARKQGSFSVVTATGLILKRGNDLKRVLAVLEKGVRLVD